LNSFGIFEEYYAADQLAHKSSSTIAWIGAVSIFFLFAISVASGAMLDIFGPGVSLSMFTMNKSLPEFTMLADNAIYRSNWECVCSHDGFSL
jgi:hypothetical protein